MNKRLLSWLLGAINFVLGVVELFLGIRFILKIFGANAAAPFVRFMYESSAPLLDPFRGMFPERVFEGQYVLEFSTLFAMVMYALLAYLLIELVMWIHRSAK